MWDSVTHVRNVTLGESKQRIYTIDILASDAVTHYENVTKGEIHVLFLEKELAHLVWDSVTHVKYVTICEPNKKNI